MTRPPVRQFRTVPSLLMLAILLAIAAPAMPGQIPADAAALIDKHVAWLGGSAALEALREIKLQGSFEFAGLSGPLTVLSRRDGRQRTEVDLKVLKFTEVLAGDDSWEQNASGQVEQMGQDKVADLTRELGRAFGMHYRGDGVTVSREGSEEKNGRSWSIVRFTYPDGDVYDLLIDPETGESSFSRSVRDGRAFWTEVSDVRKVGDLRFAFRQETEGETPRQAQKVTWDRIEANSGIPDASFARPAASASGFRMPAGTTASDWMPIELHKGRYVYLKGEVNGVATDILLDSGAGMTALDRSVAGKAGLQPEGSLDAQGVGGSVDAGLVSGVTVKMGDVVIGPLSAAVLDLGDVGQRIGRPVPVILGKEVFHGTVVDLDYPNSRIRFLDPSAFRYEGTGRKLELIAGEEGHKSLMISIEGGEPVVVGLDTGQRGALTVFGHYAEARNFLSGRMVSEVRSGGVGGATTSKAATLRSVSIAGYELREVPATFHTVDVKGAFDTKRQEGNLGAGILCRFRVVFDYSRNCIWLEPGQGLKELFPKDKTGLSVEWADNTLVVVFVAPGSPAAEARWKTGTRIATLDGEPAGPDYWKTFDDWARSAAGKKVRFTLEDGTERTLTLRSYF